MRIQSKWMSIAAVTALLAVSVAGCGGGSDPQPGSNLTPSNTITRVTDSDFSESAKILAARDAASGGTTWVSADIAKRYDADLGAIRAAYPQVKDIEALPDYDLHSILVTVKPSAATWINHWVSGNLTSGEKAVDDLLTEFAPEKVEAITTPDGDSVVFELTFGQSLNMVKLAERLNSASGNIEGAEPNYTIGDGNNISETTATDGTRNYVFVQGSGDCPAGCINKQRWTFTVSADGKTVTQTGKTGTSTAK